MAPPLQIRQDATQEVGVAVVPIRDDGMGVENDLHLATAVVTRWEYSACSCADCRDNENWRARVPASAASRSLRTASPAKILTARDQPLLSSGGTNKAA